MDNALIPDPYSVERLLAAIDAGQSLSQVQVDAGLSDLFGSLKPAGAQGELHFVSWENHVPQGLMVVLQLFIWEPGRTMIRSIKEQRVYLLPGIAPSEFPRAVRCLRGWALALSELFETDKAETWMPHDLAPARAWALKRPRDAEDWAFHFARAWKL